MLKKFECESGWRARVSICVCMRGMQRRCVRMYACFVLFQCLTTQKIPTFFKKKGNHQTGQGTNVCMHARACACVCVRVHVRVHVRVRVRVCV